MLRVLLVISSTCVMFNTTHSLYITLILQICYALILIYNVNIYCTLFVCMYIYVCVSYCSMESEPLRGLYPPIEPYNTGFLHVDDLHQLYYEECGNKTGTPLIIV